MWNNFCAVVVDLFWFALGVHASHEITVYGVGRQQTLVGTRRAVSPRATQFMLPGNVLPPVLSNVASVVSATAHSTPVAATDVHTQSAAILHAPVVMYVSAPAGTACINAPQIDFDAVIEILSYGTAVTVIGYQGRFASVNRSNITGWVLKDDITPQKNDVWPSFIPGHSYEAVHPDTTKTRLLINDMFGAGALSLPLQAGEYIALRLKSEHRAIPWNRKRPRIVGTWSKLLRGTPGIHIGVNPKTDSIMEWQVTDDEGQVGYVESVSPENVMTVGMVGAGEAGNYSVKTMSEEIWRELRPVFIEVV
jgi:hypothetical protein